MLELSKGNIVVLIIGILLILIWFVYLRMLKKHKKLILAFYLRKIDRITRINKKLSNIMDRYPNKLTLMLVNMVLHITTKRFQYIRQRTTEIMNSDITWRMKNE